MSREVLLKVSSSAIELADATTTQTSPIRMDGAAARRPARQPGLSASEGSPRGGAASPSRSADAMLRMVLVTRDGRPKPRRRTRSFGRAAPVHQDSAPQSSGQRDTIGVLGDAGTGDDQD